MDWTGLLYILGLVLGIVMIVGLVKRNPESFKGANINKSFFTLGILALILIAVVVICILLVRN